jgi:hypothetical protein
VYFVSDLGVMLYRDKKVVGVSLCRFVRRFIHRLGRMESVSH